MQAAAGGGGGASLRQGTPGKLVGRTEDAGGTAPPSHSLTTLEVSFATGLLSWLFWPLSRQTISEASRRNLTGPPPPGPLRVSALQVLPRRTAQLLGADKFPEQEARVNGDTPPPGRRDCSADILRTTLPPPRSPSPPHPPPCVPIALDSRLSTGREARAQNAAWWAVD